LQALRAAKEAGLSVDAGRIQKAISYLAQLQVSKGEDPRYGAFRYRLATDASEDRVSFALTAASIASPNETGECASRAAARGNAFVRHKDPLTAAVFELPRWPWYARLYATQASCQYRDLRPFRQWYPALVAKAGADQSSDGGSSAGGYGDIYAT